MALPSHRNTEWALSSNPKSTEIPLTKGRERLPSPTGHHSAKPQTAQAGRPEQHFPLLLCVPTWQNSHLQTSLANCCPLPLTHLPYSSQAAPPQPDSHYSARKAGALMSTRRHTGSRMLTIIFSFILKGLQAVAGKRNSGRVVENPVLFSQQPSPAHLSQGGLWRMKTLPLQSGWVVTVLPAKQNTNQHPPNHFAPDGKHNCFSRTAEPEQHLQTHLQTPKVLSHFKRSSSNPLIPERCSWVVALIFWDVKG